MSVYWNVLYYRQAGRQEDRHQMYNTIIQYNRETEKKREISESALQKRNDKLIIGVKFLAFLSQDNKQKPATP